MKNLSFLLFIAGLVCLQPGCKKKNVVPNFEITVSPGPRNFVHELHISSTLSKASGYTYLWTFGDGTTSTANEEVHYYKATGVYTITLTINNDEAKKVSKVIGISPNLDFFMSGIPLPGRSVSFNLKWLQLPDCSYLWDFGDGNTSADSFPVHTYADTGQYSVTLLVNNNSAYALKRTVSILNDPLYTHLIPGSRNWHGTRSELMKRVTNTMDTSFAINYVNEVAVAVGKDTLVYDPARSAGNILCYKKYTSFGFDSTGIAYDHTKDTIGYYRRYSYGPFGNSKAQYFYEYRLHTP
ncbi:MAG: cell surface protein [Flavipsychrobacter sp.]|jgi:chitodextrinase|nr:cell surface protein [Flavipsychrobacter sp.]